MREEFQENSGPKICMEESWNLRWRLRRCTHSEQPITHPEGMVGSSLPLPATGRHGGWNGWRRAHGGSEGLSWVSKKDSIGSSAEEVGRPSQAVGPAHAWH